MAACPPAASRSTAWMVGHRKMARQGTDPRGGYSSQQSNSACYWWALSAGRVTLQAWHTALGIPHSRQPTSSSPR